MRNLSFKVLIRALRLPFITASAFPFIFGSVLAWPRFDLIAFSFGLWAVIFMHLGANLINDYADSKSLADWQDKKWYYFFGGSKLIQENKLSLKFYLCTAMICFLLSLGGAIILAFRLSTFSILFYFFFILVLGFSYSHKPLQLSYRYLGEAVIFILFGPALVMGAFFIQTRIFPDLMSFLTSIPFGLLTTAILFSNEVPDYLTDLKVHKFNWVKLAGPKYAYLLYLLIYAGVYISILLCVYQGYVNAIAMFSLVSILPASRASIILKKHYNDKEELILSSKITIANQALISVVLIMSLL